MSDFGLKAVLTADITSFEGAMLSALSIAKSFASSFESSMSQSIDRIAKVFKDSGNFDITVGAMQKLQFAASQTGTSVTMLETAMRRMSKNIGSGTFGEKNLAVDALKQLGLDPKELAAMNIDQQLLKVGAAFEKVKNTTQAVTLSMRLFGIAGTREMQFLKELGENSAKFDRLMKPQSELDGSKIYGAKQALKEFGSILENIYDQLAVKIAPVITNIIEKMEDWGFTGKDLQSKIDAAYESLGHFAVDSIAYGMAFNDMWPKIWNNIKTVFGGIAAYTKSLMHDLGEFMLFVEPAVSAVLNTVRTTSFLLDMGELKSSIKDAEKSLAQINKIYDDAPHTKEGRGHIGEMIVDKQNEIFDLKERQFARNKEYNDAIVGQNTFEKAAIALRDATLTGFVDPVKDSLKELKMRAQDYKEKARTIWDEMNSGRALAEAEARLPRGRNGNQELMDEMKTNPIGYALQITSAANIPSMQLAAKEVQEVHAPGVEKAIDNLSQIMQGQNAGTVGVFGP